MKLYVHLIYLLGLLCFWEMVIQPEGIRHEARSKKHEMLNDLNIRQIDANNQAILAAIEKANADYPSPSAAEYNSRAHNAFDCFGDARDQLQRLKAADFWRFRTENYVLFREVTDNGVYSAGINLFIDEEDEIARTGEIMKQDFPTVNHDFRVRLAMATAVTANYCASRNSGGGCGFDKFIPGLIDNGLFTKIGKSVSLGAVYSAFSSRDLKIYNNQLPPEKDGIITLDTTIQNPGSYQIPFRLFSRRTHSGILQYDTVSFDVFPR